jgi:hypothetical protein
MVEREGNHKKPKNRETKIKEKRKNVNGKRMKKK